MKPDGRGTGGKDSAGRDPSDKGPAGRNAAGSALDGKVVVVTGGTRGVGAGIAGAFCRAGAEVVVCARRPPEKAIPGSEFIPMDVRDPDAAEDFFAEVAARRGRLDVLVNNAGGTPHRRLAEGGAARHARVLELNLLAPMALSIAAHPHLRAVHGSIVMIGSVSGSRPSPGSAAYGAAKAGLESLARSMAVEWAPHVRVNTVVLGMVRTELSRLHYGDEEGIAAVGRTVPLGRLAEPADAGAAAVFLASPGAAYISGASLLVHGGGERPAFLEAATAGHALREAGGGPAPQRRKSAGEFRGSAAGPGHPHVPGARDDER
ncbi:SDR family oxidoreductase [Streptomyces pristinaespiralis]|uniref:SDR family oxidoreductase n=1 Tax=Streptomyces pristinaespiralis TaxID=38300 RepID=UPI003833824E